MSKLWKAIELVIIFTFFPLLMKFNKIPLPRIIVLLIVFIFILIISIKSGYIDKNSFRIPKLDRKYWLKMGGIYLGTFLVLTGYVYFILQQAPFVIVRERPLLMLIIAIFYPLVSAFPQELIYRTFYFSRYKTVFSEKQLLITNMILFSWLHIIYNNVPAIILTLLSGLIFTCNYHRKGSLILVTIEHSILGIIVFLTGMGQYFYK